MRCHSATALPLVGMTLLLPLLAFAQESAGTTASVQAQQVELAETFRTVCHNR